MRLHTFPFAGEKRPFLFNLMLFYFILFYIIVFYSRSLSASSSSSSSSCRFQEQYLLLFCYFAAERFSCFFSLNVSFLPVFIHICLLGSCESVFKGFRGFMVQSESGQKCEVLFHEQNQSSGSFLLQEVESESRSVISCYRLAAAPLRYKTADREEGTDTRTTRAGWREPRCWFWSSCSWAALR